MCAPADSKPLLPCAASPAAAARRPRRAVWRPALPAVVALVAGLLGSAAVAHPARAEAGCPQLPESLQLQVSGSTKNSAWLCEARTRDDGELVFHMHVGPRPNTPKSLVYHGTTSAPQRTLVWFHAPNPDPEQRNRKTYYTFVPGADPGRTVMVYFTTCNDADFRRRADIAGRIQLG